MPNTPDGHPISDHALLRFQQRKITVEQIDTCIAHGASSPGRDVGTTEYHNVYGGGGGGRRRANCLFVVTGYGGMIVTAYRHNHR